MKARNLIVVLMFSSISMVTTIASAEVIPGTDLSIHFESGHIVGSGRHINMHRIPVIDVNTGQMALYDASFKFTFLPNQGFVFEEISSVLISQPVQSITNIATGLYRTQSEKCLLLEGPTVLNQNRLLYTLRGVEGTVNSINCGSGDNFSAQIISGPAAAHPDIGGREIVSNLTENWVYGFMADRASNSAGSPLQPFLQNHLIGVRQSGEQLVLGRFSDDGVDFKEPVQTLILTRATQ